jgi:Flp pilus assembly protein TadG
MMRVCSVPIAGRQHGVAIIEFTIALPVLLLLMLATAELGRVLSQYDTLTKTVRDSCRYVASKAAVGTTTVVSITPQLQTEAGNLVAYGNINGTGAALLPSLTPATVTVSDAGNGFVSVSATYAYSPMIGNTLPTFGFGNPISLQFSLTTQVTMRAL